MNTKEKEIQQIQKYFLIGIVLLFLILFFRFIAPFLMTLFLASIIVVVSYPLYRWIHSKVYSRGLASLFTLILIFLLFLAPISFFLLTMVSQASDTYMTINSKINDFLATDRELLSILDNYPLIKSWLGELLEKNPLSLEDIASWVTTGVRSISGFILEQGALILKQIALLAVHFFIFLLALFYFFLDGPRFIRYIKSILPLSHKHKDELFQKIDTMMNSFMLGEFGGALAQGIVLGIGLWIAGFPNVVFWAALGALFSPVPYIGVGIVWVPITISLFLTGQIGSGIFLAIWGVGAIAQIDNLVKPFLIGAKATLHPFAVMIALLGGTLAFGISGLVFGPFVLMMTLAFLHIYRLEFGDPALSPEQEIPVKKKKTSFLKKWFSFKK